MGNKGDKLSQDSVISAEELVTKLSPIGGISSKKMFGGHGIFHDGKMFGIIDSKGRAFFRVNAATASDFEKKGTEQHRRMPYFSIPIEFLETAEELLKWARKSIEVSKQGMRTSAV